MSLNTSRSPRRSCPGQVADGQVARIVTVEHQHSRGIARVRRAERDTVGREIEIEKVDLHLGTAAAFAGALAGVAPGSVSGAPPAGGATTGAGV